MELEISRRGLITLGGLGILAALTGPDLTRQPAFAANLLAVVNTGKVSVGTGSN